MTLVKLSGAAAPGMSDAARRHIATAIRVLETEASALAELSRTLDENFARAIETLARTQGRVIVTGMGKSGHVARKIAATMASTGTPAFFVHPAETSHGDMGMITRDDTVLALSNSGEARELNDLVEYTRRFAIPLVCMTSRPHSTLAERSDVPLILPDCPEACPNGLAPTTSTTLMMALGDALAVVLLEKKGFTATDFKMFHPGGKLGQQLLKVSDIMHAGDALPIAAEGTPVAEAVKTISAKGFGCVIVVGAEGQLSGIITDGDLRRHLSADMLTRPARDIMTRAPKTATPDMLAAEAVAIMNNLGEGFRKITCLVVVDADARPVGLLHLHYCLRAGLA